MGCNIPRPWKRPSTPIYKPPEMPKTAPVKKNDLRTNCPNCCAVITGPVCEYCGTRFPELYKQSVVKCDRVLPYDELHNVVYGMGIKIPIQIQR